MKPDMRRIRLILGWFQWIQDGWQP